MDNRKKIQFKYPAGEKGKKYTLEFSIGILRRMETKGKFKVGELQDKLLSAPVTLFDLSFELNHADVPESTRKAIFDQFTRYSEDSDGESTLTDVLGEMLNEVIESMNPSGNLKWRVN